MKMNRHNVVKSIGAVMLALVLAVTVGGFVPKLALAGGTVTVTLANAGGLDSDTEFDFTMYKVGHFSGPGIELEDNLKGSGADVSFPSDSTETEEAKASRMLASASKLAKYIDDNNISLTAIGGVHKLKPGQSFDQLVEENALYLVRSNTVRDSADGSKFNWTPQPVYVAVLNGDSSITISNDVVVKIIKSPVVLNHRVTKSWTIPDGVNVAKPSAIYVNIRYAGKIVDTVKLESDTGYSYAWSSKEDGNTYTYIGKDDDGEAKEVSFKPDAAGSPKWTCDEILDADDYTKNFNSLAYENATARTFTKAEADEIAKLAKRFDPSYADPENIDPAVYPVDQAAQIAEHTITNTYAKTELKFTKKLDGFVNGGDKSNVTMAFRVVAKDGKGNTVYDNTLGITFSKNDAVDENGKYFKEETVTDIPANAVEVTVSEVYSAGYEGSDSVKATKGDDGVWTATMDNTHGPGQGSGVVNRYGDGELKSKNGLIEDKE